MSPQELPLNQTAQAEAWAARGLGPNKKCPTRREAHGASGVVLESLWCFQSLLIERDAVAGTWRHGSEGDFLASRRSQGPHLFVRERRSARRGELTGGR